MTYSLRDDKLKYRYALLLMVFYGLLLLSSSLFMLPVAMVPFLVAVFYILPKIRDRVIISDDGIKFARLFSKNVEYSDILTVSFDFTAAKATIDLDDGKSISRSLGKYATADDLTVFREMFADLIRRYRANKRNARIDSRAAAFADPQSEEYRKFTEARTEAAAALKGIGGWLIGLVIMMAYGAFALMKDIANLSFSLLRGQTAGEADWVAIAAYLALDLAIVIYTAVLFVPLIRKRKRFPTAFLRFQIIHIVLQIVKYAVYQCFLSTATMPVEVILLFGAVMMIGQVVWFFGWRSYFKLSVRVKNTFIN